MPIAKINQVFVSIQGEGVFIGVPQIFVRFSGCNLTCKYCDVPRELPEKEFTVQELCHVIATLNKKDGPVHSLSLTGGEPLIQADFLRNLLPYLKRKGFKVYLETNGTLPAKLKKVGRWCDFIAMDIKLPSATGGKPLWEVHKNFLKESLTFCPAPKTFVKVVVTGGTIPGDIKYAARFVHSVNSEVTLVIQPVVNRRGKITVSAKKLLEFLRLTQKFLPSVRLIPPVHQFLGLP